MPRKVYATTFRVKVSLVKDGNKYLVNDTITPLVVNWYKERSSWPGMSPSRAMVDVLVQPGASTGVVAITYIGPKNRDLENMLADPDDDGNYPLRIDRESYLVVGKKSR